MVLSTDQANPSRRVLPHVDTRGIAVSPDGMWVVTASHTSGTIKVRDARTGGPVHDFPANPRHRSVVLFSPDGRWLSTNFNEQGSELIDTATWTSKMRFWNVFGPSVFSPDSATYAFETYEGSIVLVELANGRELARFDDPDGSRAAQMVFSPDGTELIATLVDQHLIRIWDLRAVENDWPRSTSTGARRRRGNKPPGLFETSHHPRRKRSRMERGRARQVGQPGSGSAKVSRAHSGREAILVEQPNREDVRDSSHSRAITARGSCSSAPGICVSLSVARGRTDQSR